MTVDKKTETSEQSKLVIDPKKIKLSEEQINNLGFVSEVENLVFEGGGIRGIAFGGALKFMEEHNLTKQIKRIAGSSAGSIVAGAVAVGYTGEEIIELLKVTDFETFKDGGMFALKRLFWDYGYYKGDIFKQWYGKVIQKKTGNPNTTFKQVYENFGKELVITGSCLNKSTSTYFHYTNYPDMKIVDAVRISMSIPMVFQAVELDGDIYVDGGLFNNYPIWIFDTPDMGNYGQLTDADIAKSKTLGFKLATDTEREDYRMYYDNNKINSIYDYLKCLINGMSIEIERSHIHKGYWEKTIAINTFNVSSLDFAVDKKTKMQLVKHGYEATKYYFYCQVNNIPIRSTQISFVNEEDSKKNSNDTN